MLPFAGVVLCLMPLLWPHWGAGRLGLYMMAVWLFLIAAAALFRRGLLKAVED